MNLAARVTILAEDIRSYPKFLDNLLAEARAANIYDPEFYVSLEDAHVAVKAIADTPLPTETTSHEQYVFQKISFLGTDTAPSFAELVTRARQHFADVFAHARQYEQLTRTVELLTSFSLESDLKGRPDAVLQHYERALPRAYTDYAQMAAERFPKHKEHLKWDGLAI